MNQRSQNLVAYEIQEAPMGESYVYRRYEMRSSGLRGIAMRLGANTDIFDRDEASSRRADIKRCPACAGAAHA